MIRTGTIESQGTRVGRLTLDRPDKKNALTPPMLEALISGVSTLVGDAREPRIGALLVDGEGAAFCAGFDLTLCRENSDALRLLLDGLSRFIIELRTCPVPVVLAAHGAAIAGGCAMLGGADLVVTHTDAKIGYPVVRLGISPAVSAPFFVEGVGHGRAREKMLDSALMSGWDAFRYGLAHECLEDAGKVRERALVIAQQLAAKPRCGLLATKKWMNELSVLEDEHRWPAAALETSMSLVGSEEERARLVALWKN